jgi:phage-related protein
MSWNVEFFTAGDDRNPVRDFIKSLEEKDRLKVLNLLHALKEHGPALRMPHSRKMKNSDRLFELRTRGRNHHRIFYAFYTGQTVVILHGFTKKTLKTPKKELETAEARMEMYIKEKEGHKYE